MGLSYRLDCIVVQNRDSKRLIREYAIQHGIKYSEAARQLEYKSATQSEPPTIDGLDATLVERVAEALSDSLIMLGVNPDERPEHGGPTTGEVLAVIAVRAIRPDSELLIIGKQGTGHSWATMGDSEQSEVEVWEAEHTNGITQEEIESINRYVADNEEDAMMIRANVTELIDSRYVGNEPPHAPLRAREGTESDPNLEVGASGLSE